MKSDLIINKNNQQEKLGYVLWRSVKLIRVSKNELNRINIFADGKKSII